MDSVQQKILEAKTLLKYNEYVLRKKETPAEVTSEKTYSPKLGAEDIIRSWNLNETISREGKLQISDVTWQ